MTFAKFQYFIEHVTNAIGEPKLRPAVAEHAIDCLQNTVREKRGLKSWGVLDYGTWWTTCTPEEFAAAIDLADMTVALGTSSLLAPPSAEAKWRGTMLRIRGKHLQVEGGGYRLFAGSIREDIWRYDTKTRTYPKDAFVISMDKKFLACAGHAFAKHADTKALGMPAAEKAMKRLVEKFLGVKL